jgi:hypothetical protein
MPTPKKFPEVQWNAEISEDHARAILGSAFFDQVVAKGAGFCAGRARGWWDANDCEFHAAYNCAARVAREKAAAPEAVE